MKKFLVTSFINILILGALAFIAYQLFTLNTLVKNNFSEVKEIQVLQLKNQDFNFTNIDYSLDQIYRCSAKYSGAFKALDCR